jgi:hypothetical protein
MHNIENSFDKQIKTLIDVKVNFKEFDAKNLLFEQKLDMIDKAHE